MITPATATKPDATAQLAERIETDYRAAVCRLAAGDDVPQAELREALMLAGRTPQELQADVAQARQRRQWHDDLAEANDLDAQSGTASVKLMQLNAEIDELIAEHEKRLLPLLDERAELRAAAHKARVNATTLRSSRQQLRRTASPAILAEIADCHRRADELANQMAGAERSVAEALAAVEATAAMRQEFNDWRDGKPTKLLPQPAWLRKGFHGHNDTIPAPADCDLASIERFITTREQDTAERLKVARHSVETIRQQIGRNAERIEALERQTLDWRNFGHAEPSRPISSSDDGNASDADEAALRREMAELKAAT